MTDHLKVALAAWIIQDGNYGNFKVGARNAFALEFTATKPLTVRHPAAIDKPLSLQWRRAGFYDLKGSVSFTASDWWVLNVGLLMYQTGRAPGPPGTLVRGEVEIGIDPFPYFERLAVRPDAPPLIYDWQIASIDLDVSPRIEVSPKVFESDRTRELWRSVKHTDAWNEEGDAAYVLTCERLPGEPRHKR